MALNDLLRFRKLLRYGVGQTTQRNNVLPFHRWISKSLREWAESNHSCKTVAPDTLTHSAR